MVESYSDLYANLLDRYKSNPLAFAKFILRPRVLVDVANFDTSTTIFGRRIPFPICVAPTALHNLAHPDGERATAEGCSRVGVSMAMSSYSSTSWDDIVAMGQGRMDFVSQLYIYPDKELTKHMVQKAESK